MQPTATSAVDCCEAASAFCAVSAVSEHMNCCDAASACCAVLAVYVQVNCCDAACACCAVLPASEQVNCCDAACACCAVLFITGRLVQAGFVASCIRPCSLLLAKLATRVRVANECSSTVYARTSNDELHQTCYIHARMQARGRVPLLGPVVVQTQPLRFH